MNYRILAINPGSTSTKVAVYEEERLLFNDNIQHPQESLEQYGSLLEQIPLRRQTVLDTLEKHSQNPKNLSVVMGRGGLFPPIHTGGYLVNEAMLSLIMQEEIPSHASNLGAVLAKEIAQIAGVNAFIYDAVSANEFPPVAKITGIPEIERKSFCHVLNSRAVAIRYATSQNKRYQDMNLMVVHMGGGITVGVHKQGKIVDSLADDNGPFSPERAGNVPLFDIIDLCYSGKYEKKDMAKKIRGMGGLRALVGTSDCRVIEQRIAQGDQRAKLALEAQAYQIAKGVGLLSPVLGRSCEAIILTGGLAYSKMLMDMVVGQIDFIAPVILMPGEYEMEALAMGGLRILRGEEPYREM